MKLRICPRFPSRFSTTIVSATLLLGLAGCGGDAVATEHVALDTDGIVVVTNSRANVPIPRLSTGNADLIRQALDQGMPVVVVSADGTPEQVDLPIPEVKGNNDNARAKSLQEAVDRVAMAITAKPNSDGADAYGAFAVARHAARSQQMKSPTIICLQCGIDTQGALAMTAEGALRADPQDYLTYLTNTRQLVGFEEGFDEVHVILTSTGITAPPQEPLSPRDKEHLTSIWSDVLAAGGASVTVDPNPAGGDPIDTEHTVPTVSVPTTPAMPAGPVCTPESISFDGASAARFEPETDHWVDVGAAREALRPLAEWLQASPTRTARVFGTTADTHSGDPDEGKALSLARAEAATKLLRELGVADAQIVHIEGLGPHYEGRVRDHDAAGDPIPSERTKNRKVIVEIAEPC